MATMEPRAKLWIEQDGRLVLSDYRVRLLEHIDETGSLSEAAARMQLSYRRAWGKVKEIEQNIGTKLVESAAGGPGGGGSHLTTEGRRLVALYREFHEHAERDLTREFTRIFEAGRR